MCEGDWPFLYIGFFLFIMPGIIPGPIPLGDLPPGIMPPSTTGAGLFAGALGAGLFAIAVNSFRACAYLSVVLQLGNTKPRRR